LDDRRNRLQIEGGLLHPGLLRQDRLAVSLPPDVEPRSEHRQIQLMLADPGAVVFQAVEHTLAVEFRDHVALFHT